MFLFKIQTKCCHYLVAKFELCNEKRMFKQSNFAIAKVKGQKHIQNIFFLEKYDLRPTKKTKLITIIRVPHQKFATVVTNKKVHILFCHLKKEIWVYVFNNSLLRCCILFL